MVIANYLNLYFDLGINVDFHSMFSLLPNNGNDALRGIPACRHADNPDIPLILGDHAVYNQVFNDYPVIFMLRGIEDTLVSQYFQVTNRLNVFSGDLGQFIQHPDYGLARLARYLNGWAPFILSSNSSVLSYEQMHSSPLPTMERIIQFIGLGVDKEILETALQASSFDSMRKLELNSGFPNPGLSFDSSDANALRTRKGMAGNYIEYMDEKDLAYINMTCSRLLTSAAQDLLGSVNLGRGV